MQVKRIKIECVTNLTLISQNKIGQEIEEGKVIRSN